MSCPDAAYPPEVRAEAVRLARSSERSIPALAADLRGSIEALRHSFQPPATFEQVVLLSDHAAWR